MINISALMLLSEGAAWLLDPERTREADVEPAMAGENLGKSGHSWGSPGLAPLKCPKTGFERYYSS